MPASPSSSSASPNAQTRTCSKKRGVEVLLLEHYESSFVRPSKYLLLSKSIKAEDEEENIDELNAQVNKEETNLLEENEGYPLSKGIVSTMVHHHSSSVEERRGTLLEIGKDCLLLITQYLELHQMKNCILSCKYLGRLLIPSFMELSKDTLEYNEHLIDLIDYGLEYESRCSEGTGVDGLFTEQATWKGSIWHHDDDEDLFYGNFSEDEDLVETLENNTIYRMAIPFGSPLCKGTIRDQFELVQDDIDVDSYREVVKKQLGLSIEEQGSYEFNPFIFYNEIMREDEMSEPYADEIQQSLALHFSDEYDELSNEERASSKMTFYGLRKGLIDLIRRAGVLYFEPYFIEDALYLLKKIIYLVIKDAYEKKFPNKTQDLEFKEPIEHYSRYYRDLDDFNVPCFNDEIDSDLKISAKDIENSFENVFSKKLYYGPSKDGYLTRTNQDYIEDVLDKSKSIQTYHRGAPAIPRQTYLSGYNNAFNYYRQYQPLTRITNSESEAEESESDSTSSCYSSSSEEVDCMTDSDCEEILDETSQEEETDSFIDDSECCNFDLENLGNSLPEQLLKVSMNIHEEVYGKERAHTEKLYLKNWYGNSSCFFMNCSHELENPQQQEHNEELKLVDEVKNSEKEQIEIDKKEDFEYFGYSLYEDDFNEFPIFDNFKDDVKEQATEEESLTYQVRRMLREQSYECIVNYHLDNKIP